MLLWTHGFFHIWPGLLHVIPQAHRWGLSVLWLLQSRDDTLPILWLRYFSALRWQSFVVPQKTYINTSIHIFLPMQKAEHSRTLYIYPRMYNVQLRQQQKGSDRYATTLVTSPISSETSERSTIPAGLPSEFGCAMDGHGSMDQGWYSCEYPALCFTKTNIFSQ